MKKTQLILFAIIGLAFTTTLMSCDKTTTDEPDLGIINQAKGSINLTVGTQTYTELFSSVVYSTSDTMVSFWGINLDTEDSFIVTFGTVPEVGKSKNVSMLGDPDILFMIQGAFQQGGFYSGESGTITRLTTDKYEINVELNDSQNPNTLINISGTVIVGETN